MRAEDRQQKLRILSGPYIQRLVIARRRSNAGKDVDILVILLHGSIDRLGISH